jgi:hypothetical protein
MRKTTIIALLSAAVAGVTAQAMPVQVRVTVENLAAANSIGFAPLRVGFGAGQFDAFNQGQAAFLLGNPDIATAPIVTVAEGGSGSTWFPAFAAAEPNAVLGSVLPNPAGPLLPGATGTAVFTVDPAVNPFFTFAAMVIPSTDYFIGNDSPTAHRLFNADGTLAITTINQTASDIWNAGSETENPLNGAFVQGGTNANRVNENGVVEFDFDLASDFNGVTTGAGYVFDSQLVATTPVYRISFSVVPEPSSLAVLGSAAILMLRRRA